MTKEEVKKITQDYMKDYTTNRATIIKAFTSSERKMLELCAYSGIPVIAAYGYIYEHLGDVKYYNKLVELIKFYGL